MKYCGDLKGKIEVLVEYCYWGFQKWRDDLLSRIKNIDYSKKLKPIYIESMEANQIYIKDCANMISKPIKYKIGKDWIEFKKISTRKAVLNDSLFLRFMKSSITRNTDDTCKDFVVVKFNYDADFMVDNEEINLAVHELRNIYYEKGITLTYEKKNKENGKKENYAIHYKMLMRTTGKAKKGECVFIRDSLHGKAINFLTMGLYDLMDKQSKNDPKKVFRLVELSAYQTLTTASSIGYIQIPLENILIVKDVKVLSDKMKAAIVSNDMVEHEDTIRFPDFDNPEFERLINKKGYTFDKKKAEGNGLTLISKSKEALKENGIRPNGKYPYMDKTEKKECQECKVDFVSDANIENVLWDGMGICDEEIFLEGMNGFIYCRSHFFKSCLFRGNIQEFFKDYCREHDDIDYDTYTTENVDMFGRALKLQDIKVIISDKSIKWISKFEDMMGGTEEKAYKYYRRYMKRHGDYFSIVKTAHPSKWGDLQLMAYQMGNSLPTTDEKILGNVSKCGVDVINTLKESDKEYLKYLNMTKNDMNIHELTVELVKWNSDFVKTKFFRDRKSKNISKLKDEFMKGRLPQLGDNLTIMDNPVALLMRVFGESPMDEGCFELVNDGIQCYTPRFSNGERLAAFRSPHNSPNNIIHLHNVYPEKLLKYFPNIGQNVIVFNAIKTDTQARLSGHDVDSDFVYVTNQEDLADLARIAYTKYPTIINKVDEKGNSEYHFTPLHYAKMDYQISDAQSSIGTSTDAAQLALSYYYADGMKSKELEECFIILSVIGQISIDLAKKTFELDVVNEIKRIQNLPCMRRKEIPLFFAKNKKDRNNKVFSNGKIVTSMKCPMDIMAKSIKDNTKKRAEAVCHLPLDEFLNKGILGKGNKYKEQRVIDAANEYNKSKKWLEDHKNRMNDSSFFALENRAMRIFLNKTTSAKKKYLDQESVIQLVLFAINDDNSDVCTTILNFLFKNYNDEFLNCFVKSVPKRDKNFTKSA